MPDAPAGGEALILGMTTERETNPFGPHQAVEVTHGYFTYWFGFRSDRASGGVYQDKGIPALEEWLSGALATPFAGNPADPR